MQNQQMLAGMTAVHHVMMRQAAQEHGADMGVMQGLQACNSGAWIEQAGTWSAWQACLPPLCRLSS